MLHEPTHRGSFPHGSSSLFENSSYLRPSHYILHRTDPPKDPRMSIAYLLRPVSSCPNPDEPWFASQPPRSCLETMQDDLPGQPEPSKETQTKEKKPLRWVHLQAETTCPCPPTALVADAIGGSFGLGDGLVYSRPGGRSNKRKRQDSFSSLDESITTVTTTTQKTTTTTCSPSLRDSGDNDHELLERFRYISSAIASQQLAHQNPQPPTTFQQEDSFMRRDANVKDGTDKDGSSGVVLPARQRRKRLCSYQVRMLQVHFEMNPFPTDEAKRTLAVSLQLTTKQVQNW